MFSATFGLKDWSIMELLLWTPFIYTYTVVDASIGRGAVQLSFMWRQLARFSLVPPTVSGCSDLTLKAHGRSDLLLNISLSGSKDTNILLSFHFAQFPVKSFTWNNSILARKLPSQNSQSLLGLFSSILISTKILPQISHEELTAQIVPKFVSFPKNCLSIYCCLASEEEAAQIVHENVPNF